MSENAEIPELKEIIGSLILAARRQLTLAEIRKNLKEVGEKKGGHYATLAQAEPSAVRNALKQLREDMKRARLGFHITEIAGGFRLQTDDNTGAWVRHFIHADAPHRLSRPALETLAIIAYRQPATRADMEAIRGVNVDHVLNVLMELQLVRIVGRSDLPGRPMLYGTTKFFLEHFGLNSVKELPAVAELAKPKDKLDAPVRTEEMEFDSEEDEDPEVEDSEVGSQRSEVSVEEESEVRDQKSEVSAEKEIEGEEEFDDEDDSEDDDENEDEEDEED